MLLTGRRLTDITYLPTYQPTFPTNLPTNQPTYQPTYLPTNLPNDTLHLNALKLAFLFVTFGMSEMTEAHRRKLSPSECGKLNIYDATTTTWL